MNAIFSFKYRRKIVIFIIGEEIDVSWNIFSSIIEYKGKYKGELEMLLEGIEEVYSVLIRVSCRLSLLAYFIRN